MCSPTWASQWPTAQIHTTNFLEQINAEVKRRANVVGFFPNTTAVKRLVGALVFDQSDERQLHRRYMQLVGLQSLSNNQSARLSAVVNRARVNRAKFHDSYTTPRAPKIEEGQPEAFDWLGVQEERRIDHRVFTTKSFYKIILIVRSRTSLISNKLSNHAFLSSNLPHDTQTSEGR